MAQYICHNICNLITHCRSCRHPNGIACTCLVHQWPRGQLVPVVGSGEVSRGQMPHWRYLNCVCAACCPSASQMNGPIIWPCLIILFLLATFPKLHKLTYISCRPEDVIEGHGQDEETSNTDQVTICQCSYRILLCLGSLTGLQFVSRTRGVRGATGHSYVSPAVVR